MIISTVRTYLRAIAAIRNPEDSLIVSTGFAVIRPGEALHQTFVGYLLSASYFIEQVIARSTGVSYPVINASELVAIPVTVPPLPEQAAIAAFLDRETAKINALVAEQERLIELLKEKRQAVISHAVTKGLNPKVPMKDSGVEWLGKIPAHWTIGQPKALCSLIVDGPHVTPSYVAEGVPFVTVKNLTKGPGIDFDDLNYVEEAVHEELARRGRPERGDVLLSKDGTLGVPRVVETDRVFSFFVSVALLKPLKSKVDPYFLRYALESDSSWQQFTAGAAGSALKHIVLRTIGNVRIALPPVAEQAAIGAWCQQEAGNINTLTAEAQRAIDLLQERRTALISAAVTGQIDVRKASGKAA